VSGLVDDEVGKELKGLIGRCIWARPFQKRKQFYLDCKKAHFWVCFSHHEVFVTLQKLLLNALQHSAMESVVLPQDLVQVVDDPENSLMTSMEEKVEIYFDLLIINDFYYINT